MVFNALKSLNFDPRAKGAKPSMIIAHYTGMEREEDALNILCDPASKVSAHYFIADNGHTYNLVDESKRAWHAGMAYWDGQTDINSHSIGIEISNPGHEFGYHDFTAPQIAAFTKLCQKLIAKYKIDASRILAHSDIAPRRKQDPGEKFPWRALAENEGIGLWPKPSSAEITQAGALLKDRAAFHGKLVEYGYNPDVPFSELILAFHRHFYPEKFFQGGKRAEPDETSAARLLTLIRMKKEG